jgi:hypothetical protein
MKFGVAGVIVAADCDRAFSHRSTKLPSLIFDGVVTVLPFLRGLISNDGMALHGFGGLTTTHVEGSLYRHARVDRRTSCSSGV